MYVDLTKLTICAEIPTWHGPDFTCNFPQTVLGPTSSRFTPNCCEKPFFPFVGEKCCNTTISSQHLSVISSKHCLCLQLELRPTGTPVRLKNPDYLGLKTKTLPDHSLKNVRWAPLKLRSGGSAEIRSWGKGNPWVGVGLKSFSTHIPS